MPLQQGPIYPSWIDLLPTAMSSVAENYTMDLFYLLKENFKNHGNEIWEFALFIKLFFATKMEISIKYAFSLNQTLFTQKYWGVASQYILRSGSLWHPLSSNMLKNKRIFSLVISKLMSAFSLYDCTA